MGYAISYDKGDIRQLTSKYKYVCSLQKENAEHISKIVKHKIKTRYEDTYAIYIDGENGTLIFVHTVNSSMQGGSFVREDVFAKVISFDHMKTLLSYELTFYNALVEKWKNENDADRSNLCKEHIRELEKIIDIKESDWKDLLSL